MTMESRSIVKSDEHHDYILLDCSSSMLDKWYDSIGAIDAYVAGLNHESLRTHIILHMFYDNNPDYVHRDCLASDWQPLVQECPGPEGGTPLYDAVNLMGLRIRAIDPPPGSIVIVTDGYNNSGQGSVEQARLVLDWLKAKGWQVVFIGADFSNARLAGLLGAEAGESIGVQKRLLTDAAKELAKKRGNHYRTGAPMHWSPDEQQQFGGYLAPPKAD